MYWKKYYTTFKYKQTHTVACKSMGNISRQHSFKYDGVKSPYRQVDKPSEVTVKHPPYNTVQNSFLLNDLSFIHMSALPIAMRGY